MSKSRKSAALGIVQKYFPHVTSVTDGDEDMTIEVTKHDSEHAARKSHVQCAFAKACQKKFQARGVLVSVKMVYVIRKEGAIRYMLPESVSREVVSFDRNGGFAEGKYLLKAPPKTHRLGRDWHGRSHQNTGTGKKPRFMHYTSNIRARMGSEKIN